MDNGLLSQASAAEDYQATVLDFSRPNSPDGQADHCKILHLINGEHFSGAERVQQLLGKRLNQFGYDATFACLKPGKFREQCNLRERQIRDFPMSGKFDTRVVSGLSKLVEAEQFEMLHAHTPRTALIAALVARRTQRKWVYHVHSPTSRDSTRGLTNRINGWVEKFAIRNCSRLLTVSKSLRREMLRQGVPRERLAVVPNGVPEFTPIDASQRTHRNAWRLGLVALMRPRKGVEIALEALSKSSKRESVTLDLIGGFETPEYETQIKYLITRYGLEDRVRLLGFQSDVAECFRELDALLLPSLFGEGMPMVVLEALSAGVPVIATRVEGTPEVVRHGVEGLFAQPRDAADFANQIDSLTADRTRWLELSKNALARHRKCFSDSVMAGGVARAYDRLRGIPSMRVDASAANASLEADSGSPTGSTPIFVPGTSVNAPGPSSTHPTSPA
ncbi:MAG TPA: glycosyltransferase family 1 protein [Planctomycetaceae bacterium]|nr:glycosyltransferase family 1 protein [Planctomycetaceae bacterium]